MKTPLTFKRLQTHFTYSWWKYALLCVLVIMFSGIYFSVTRYRPPEEKKIIVGVYGMGSQDAFDSYMEEVRTVLLPEMEDMSTQYITQDATYGDAVLTTRIAARECDIYIFPKDTFQTYSQQGAFMALEEELPELVALLEENEISLSRGWRTNSETNEKHLYGIPLADLPYADTFLFPNADSYYACVFFSTGNDENVKVFFDHFIRDMMNELPATPTDLAE